MSLVCFSPQGEHAHRDRHHCDYCYASFFKMVFDINQGGQEKHDIWGLVTGVYLFLLRLFFSIISSFMFTC
jgi:hypothetical protein